MHVYFLVYDLNVPSHVNPVPQIHFFKKNAALERLIGDINAGLEFVDFEGFPTEFSKNKYKAETRLILA